MLDSYLLKDSLATTPERALQAIKEIRAVDIEGNGGHHWKLMKIPDDILSIFAAIGVKGYKKIFQQWAKTAPSYIYQRRLSPAQEKALRNRAKK